MITLLDIKNTAQEMTATETLRLDEDRVREDLYGLFSDIVAELDARAHGRETMIYAYAELMAREQQLYIPEQAYQAGAAAREMGHERAFMDYIRCLHLNPGNQSFLKERDAMYYELRGLLGETGGLLDEFNELYRACHGIEGRNIDVFFDMGYYDSNQLGEVKN